MSYLAKMILGAWVGIVFTFFTLQFIPTVWMQIIAIIGLIGVFAFFSRTQNAQDREDNLLKIRDFWAKPIWKRICFGILIFSPPFALFLIARDFFGAGTINVGANVAVGLFFGAWMGIVYGWIHKQRNLTAQSE